MFKVSFEPTSSGANTPPIDRFIRLTFCAKESLDVRPLRYLGNAVVFRFWG